MVISDFAALGGRVDDQHPQLSKLHPIYPGYTTQLTITSSSYLVSLLLSIIWLYWQPVRER